MTILFMTYAAESHTVRFSSSFPLYARLNHEMRRRQKQTAALDLFVFRSLRNADARFELRLDDERAELSRSSDRSCEDAVSKRDSARDDSRSLVPGEKIRRGFSSCTFAVSLCEARQGRREKDNRGSAIVIVAARGC